MEVVVRYVCVLLSVLGWMETHSTHSTGVHFRPFDATMDDGCATHTRTLSHSRMRPSIRPSVVILSVSCALSLSLWVGLYTFLHKLLCMCVCVFFAPVD